MRRPPYAGGMSAIPAPESGPDAGATWHYGDPFGEQRAAETGVAVVDRSHRASIQLTGDERRKWLHTISSQHVSELPDGAVVENLNLDVQGRVEDHWLQTQLDGVTVIDTEPWRGEPLLAYLRKMIFWADVVVEPADLAVLSLIGPQVSDSAVLETIGIPALPDVASAVPLADGGFVRTLRAGEVDLVVPRATAAGWRERLTAAGVRPAGVWAYEARRAAQVRARLGVDTDERTIPHEVDGSEGRATARCTSTRAATADRRPSHGSTTWASRHGCWSCCIWTGLPTGRSQRIPSLLVDARLAGSAPSSTT